MISNALDSTPERFLRSRAQSKMSHCLGKWDTGVRIYEPLRAVLRPFMGCHGCKGTEDKGV